METSYTQSSLPQLHNLLPNQQTPWQVSTNTFQKVQSAGFQDGYKKCEITSSDPEWAFILRYFEWQKPSNRCIKRVYCIHSREMTEQFQSTLPIMEKEAANPAFAPKWQQQESRALRENVHRRWKKMTDPYAFTLEGNGRKEFFNHIKILPLWHGTKKEICQSICQSGFTFFGKQDLLQGKNDQNTDLGYFGSGIYFTNSARYAAEIYSDGNLLLAWVSMREPYPVVSHAPNLFPDKPKDMVRLEGHGAYQNYNAHHIPVIPVDPSNSVICYPCSDGETPLCDEIVVFQKSQTLTRFWIEIDVEIVKSPEEKLTVNTILQKVLNLLENSLISNNPPLAQALEEKAGSLIALDPDQAISKSDMEFYRWTLQLFDEKGQVRSFVSRKLLPQPSPQPLQNSNSQPSSAEKLPNFNQQALQPYPNHNFHSIDNNSLQMVPKIPKTNTTSSQENRIEFEIAQQPPIHYSSIKSFSIKELRTLEGHSRAANALIQLSDGTLISGAGKGDCIIKHWNPQTGDCLKTFQGHQGFLRTFLQLTGETLASRSDDNTIKIWNLQTGNCLKTLEGHSAWVSTFIVLADGSLASGSSDYTIKIWNPQTGNCKRTLVGHSQAIKKLIQLKDETLASGSYDNTIKIWNPQTGDCIKTLVGHSSLVELLIQLDDGTLASGSHDNTIKIWNPQTGDCLNTCVGHQAGVTALIQLANKTLVSGSSDKTIKIWNPQNGNCRKTLVGHSGWPVDTLIQLKDGTLVGRNDSFIKFWNLETGECLKELYGCSSLIQLADGSLAIGFDDETIRIWG